MDDIIQTPDGPKTLSVCKDGTTDNEEWMSIYEVSFPPEQRQDLDDLRQQLRAGSMELDETRDQDGSILCMTITEVFRGVSSATQPRFLLVCYTAVVPGFRGLGIGTIHRRKLTELLESEYSDYVGILSEIESTRVPCTDQELMRTRLRRKNFFLRLGLQPLAVDYLFPSYSPGEEPIHGELLWVPISNQTMDTPTLCAILKRIYTEGYGLKPDDPLIARVLSQLSNTRLIGHEQC